MNGGVVAWKSSKQVTIAMSSIESKYVVVSKAAKKSYWIKKFIEKLRVVPKVTRVHTDDSTVDPLMKELPCDKHSFHANGMGLCYIGLEQS
ncbi:hypothetical protein Tco_0155537 [Tanacetum coccineum]